MTLTAIAKLSSFLGLQRTERYLSSGLSWLLLLPALLIFVFIFVVPILGLVKLSLFDPEFTLENYRRVFSNGLYLRVIFRTIWISALVALLTLLLGYPVAALMARARGTKLLVLAGCVLVPLWISVLVRSYAWVVLLSRNGLVTASLREVGIISPDTQLMFTDGAVVLAMTHVLLPFMILPLYANLQSIPEELSRAARSLGANSVAAFYRVTLPLSLPGVYSGCVIVFVISLGFYVTPQLVGGPNSITAAMLIGQQVSYGNEWGLAAAISTILFTGALFVLLLLGWIDSSSNNRGEEN